MSGLGAWARHAMWRAMFTVRGFDVTGALPPGGCIVVAEHRSHADAPVLLAAIDAGHEPLVAAAADYWFARRSTSLVCRVFAAGFPVCRTGGGYADLAAKAPQVRAGRALVVFPAGSRHSDGTFRSGAFRLAAQIGVPVVPVWITKRGIVIGAPVTVGDPRAAADRTQRLLAAGPPAPSAAARTGLRGRVAALAASPRSAVGVACWAAAEALSLPVLTELLIAALLLAGPARPWRTGLRLAAAGAMGSALGGVLGLVLARHGVVLPEPLTTTAMRSYAHDHLSRRGVSGLWSQPASGVPYKVYAAQAAALPITAWSWFGQSLLVRAVRMFAVAGIALAAGRLTTRWARFYTAAVAAGVATFVVGLCLVASAWSE